MSPPSSLYFCAILGANDRVEDHWMLTDLSFATTLANTDTSDIHIFTTVPLRDYACCSPSGYVKFGDPASDRLELRVPDDSFVKMEIGEVKSAVHNNGTTVSWSTACFSRQWLEGNVPWHGYVAAAEDRESDSLVPSNSNYTRGGVSMLTTFATSAADHNIIAPLPYRAHHASTKPTHYGDHPTPLGEQRHRPLQELAEQANSLRREFSVAYESDIAANTQTQRPLPMPQFTNKILDRFKIIRRVDALASPHKTTRPAPFAALSNRRRPFPESTFKNRWSTGVRSAASQCTG
ncbi:hypothetical protein DFH07DRAFT_953003 [Mycena maculata]|uniref:Uncharacterized protein n=1 Tax=Mycena maculata TaxID=230809 RepID=A0AAD7JZE8_9AGAR|nr:hypothetical protein DFH07DRAFT_953003 [Mycena maculata]